MTDPATTPDSTWKLTLELPLEVTSAFEELLYAQGDDPIPTIATFEIPERPEVWTFEAYYVNRPAEDRVRQALGFLCDMYQLDMPAFVIEEVEQRDWVAESQKILKPVKTNRFFIHGSHDADKVPADRIALQIEAGQAFGTGQHGTTHGCLRAIEDIAEQGQPHNILDLGTGSGVLALAMAKIWDSPVTASDIDPIATETTIENAEINHVKLAASAEDKTGVFALTADGFDDPELAGRGPFDLIVANILAGPLIELAPEMARHLTADGRLVLSGLLDHQQERVLDAYRAQGFSLEKEYALGEWRALTLKRV
ncbi:50S ribosomal protein L11 methyltransferase [Emcibacter nanhaiensis]|uniref:50S ribosomal protein L11 methyltransferase n=1 Tax=Emcibacter nanhaiensis TaxID=1505037 RepID=UPI0015E430DE|nr:50S ribosomal protein L11 methyltransferase [Emcibacter nanhaiensis]